ncbi:hypothetical protein HZA55_10795 [Candidatus Poribacteria bacterium]|nr:hypothetical protein [Candidatus Poribacteria bacterium]
MREQGKMNALKFALYFFIGSVLGGVILGIAGYLVAAPRDKDVNLAIIIAAIFGAIFGGPLLASNLEKEK